MSTNRKWNPTCEISSEIPKNVDFFAEICIPELRDGEIEHQVIAKAYSVKQLEHLMKGFPVNQIEVHIRKSQ